jgi:hypothetical protein
MHGVSNVDFLCLAFVKCIPIRFMNLHIRADKQNQLKLRADMTDTDKAIVRSAGDKSITREAVVLLRQKMARESIYAGMRLN